VLQEWERDGIIRPLFGWKRADGTRKYRRAYIEVPRKQGKSTLVAGIALYLLFMDNEPGAQVLGAAADRDQAAVVFDLAKSMVEASPVLRPRSETYRRSIVVPSTASAYRVLSADVRKHHGLNAHGVVFDELHAQPNRDLWDVLTTATGARRQPLVVAITTAGYDRESICFEVHEHARQVLEGVLEDEEFFAFIRAAGDKDDWTDPAVWRKANPSLGVTMREDYLAAECRRAQLSPAYENTFRRLQLCQWTSQESRYLPMEAWGACDGKIAAAEPPADRTVSADAPPVRPPVCYGGLDLASSSDLAAFVLDFPPEEEGGEHQWLPTFWIPQENLIERVRKDRVPYDAWARQGLVRVTEGNVIDFQRVIADIEALGERFDIREISFDRWGAFQVSQQLADAGFVMVAFGQGFVSMSAPTKELLRLVLAGKLAHGGNPVLRWMADNLMVSQDAAGNVKPNRQKSREKIDGIVAGIMALDRALRHGQAASVYEQRGLLDL
jgi:phage terminase large subunit-like protein